MQVETYYYIAALPMLGDIGSDPPLGLTDMLAHVQARPRWRRLVGTLLLFDDLLQREAFLAGEVDSVDPAVLTPVQARNEAPLPADLVATEEPAREANVAVDDLWETYFRFAAKVGHEMGSAFLDSWVRFEVSLRNALAAARARRLGLEEADYQVAIDLSASEEDFTATMDEWAAAPTPLAGLRVVIRARWSWIDDHESWFSFSENELLVYAARLMLLEQWRRCAEERGVETSNPHSPPQRRRQT